MIENFAPNLIRLRKEKNLSQKELAKELGISAQTISNIENQTAYPTFTNLEKIAKYFSATPTDLFGTLEAITLEKSVFSTDEYSEKAEKIIRSVQMFENLQSKIYDEFTPEADVVNILSTMSRLTKKVPISDPDTQETLYIHKETGKIVRAEDKIEGEWAYEIAYHPTRLEEIEKELRRIEKDYSEILLGDPIFAENGEYFYRDYDGNITQNPIHSLGIARHLSPLEQLDKYYPKLDEVVEKIKFIKENEDLLDRM